MLRHPLAAFFLMIAACSGQSHFEPEKEADKIVDPILEIKDETAKTDALIAALAKYGAPGCGTMTEEETIYFNRILSRLQTELTHMQQTLPRLETHIMDALKAARNAVTPAEVTAANESVDEAFRQAFVLFFFIRSPKMPGILKRVLMETDKSADLPAFAGGQAFEMGREIVKDLLTMHITVVSKDSKELTQPRGLTGWRKWFASEGESGLWFRMHGFPDIHRVE